MKRPVLLMTLVILTALTSLPLQAAQPPSPYLRQHPGWLDDMPTYIAVHAFLTSTDNEREIRLLTAACAREVDALLARIAAAKTEEEVGALVREIHRAETRRDVAILSIFIDNAEASGEYGLVLEMRNQVAKMMKYDGTLQVAATP